MDLLCEVPSVVESCGRDGSERRLQDVRAGTLGRALLGQGDARFRRGRHLPEKVRTPPSLVVRCTWRRCHAAIPGYACEYRRRNASASSTVIETP